MVPVESMCHSMLAKEEPVDHDELLQTLKDMRFSHLSLRQDKQYADPLFPVVLFLDALLVGKPSAQEN